MEIMTKMNIKELKPREMEEIIDFFYHIEDYGYMFYLEPERLDEPFGKIMEGIAEIRQLMEDSYGI